MRKSQKWRFRSIALTLCMALLMSIFNPVAFAMEPEPDAVNKTEEVTLWQPDVEEAPQNTEGDLSLEVLADRILPEADAPEVVSAEAIVKNGHVNRLWAQETDLNTIIFQNKDGKKTMYYFADPVKFVDENGVTRDKKNDVTDLIDKAAYREDYGYVNADNDIKTYFPKTLSADKGVVLEHKDIKIEMSPVSGKGVTLPGIEEPPISIDPIKPDITPDNMVTDTEVNLTKTPVELKAVSAGAVKQSTAVDAKRVKDTVSFDKVFGADTSIRYTPQFNGFKEDIILNRYSGVNEFTFRLKTNGLSLINDDEGIYSFADPLSGEKLARLGDLIVYDSFVPEIPDMADGVGIAPGGKPEKPELLALTEEEIQALYFPEASDATEPTYNHKYEVISIAQDEEYLLTIVVDEDWLIDESRVYPVIIDPSITIGASGIQDATIYSNYQSADGGSVNLHVGNYTANTDFTGSRGVARTLVKFPGLMSNATFQSLSAVRIDSVKYIPRDLMCYTASVDITAFRVTAPWTESTVKCNSGNIWNAYNSSYLDWFYVYYNNGTGSTGTGTGNYYPYNITAVVKEWKAGYYGGTNNHYGIMLKAWNESDKAVRFASRENSSYPPRVIVTYDTTVPVSQVCVSPSSATLNVNSSLNISGYVTVLPSNATNKNVTYSSSNTNVATVSSGGLICASGAGSATITVKSVSDTSKYVYFYVTVTGTSVPVSSIYLNKSSVSCKVGELITLTATLNPSNATNKTVTYTSNNPSVLTFNGGAATVTVTQSDTYWIARGEGTATVTATTPNGKVAYCTFTVNTYNNSTTYDAGLATKCAEYSMLAYDGPTAINTKLSGDNFDNIVNRNYGDAKDWNVSYSLASKTVFVSGCWRTLVAIVIRGTDSVEWQGNMNIGSMSSVNHESWNEAKNDLKNNSQSGTQGLNWYLSYYSITNPIYLVTGHSRGAGVANLLAADLSATAGTSNVFAYTFATPNATQVPNNSRTNIYNFVFADDFVPQVPLNAWGYDKYGTTGQYGTTQTRIAGELYNSSPAFKADMKQKKGREAQFNYSGTQDLLDHVADKWADVGEYNNNSCFNGATIPGTTIPVRPLELANPLCWMTLHDFMHDELAKAAMKDPVGIAMVAGKVINYNYYFGPIAEYFVLGGGVLQHYIFDTHEAFTYYTAVKHGLFNP